MLVLPVTLEEQKENMQKKAVAPLTLLPQQNCQKLVVYKRVCFVRAHLWAKDCTREIKKNEQVIIPRRNFSLPGKTILEFNAT